MINQQVGHKLCRSASMTGKFVCFHLVTIYFLLKPYIGTLNRRGPDLVSSWHYWLTAGMAGFVEWMWAKSGNDGTV